MKNFGLRIPIAVIAVLVSFTFSSPVLAAHTGGNVPLRDANGVLITDGTTPYSPKATCGVCHDYGSGEKIVTKTQGVMESDGKIYWQAYTVKSYEHGVSVGRHSNEGRNEEFTNTARKTVNDPWFTSSFGMFGKL
jgi:hypothetical protein